MRKRTFSTWYSRPSAFGKRYYSSIQPTTVESNTPKKTNALSRNYLMRFVVAVFQTDLLSVAAGGSFPRLRGDFHVRQLEYVELLACTGAFPFPSARE